LRLISLFAESLGLGRRQILGVVVGAVVILVGVFLWMPEGESRPLEAALRARYACRVSPVVLSLRRGPATQMEDLLSAHTSVRLPHQPKSEEKMSR
jgi:hypothetical protein